jgi:hypothetical protein
MDYEREERIRRRAHQIWEASGRPVGQEREHWEQAVREIDGENESNVTDRQIQQGGIDEAAAMSTAPGALGTGLQPGGMRPSGGPAASEGGIGTGGGSTAGQPSGDLKKKKR